MYVRYIGGFVSMYVRTARWCDGGVRQKETVAKRLLLFANKLGPGSDWVRRVTAPALQIVSVGPPKNSHAFFVRFPLDVVLGYPGPHDTRLSFQGRLGTSVCCDGCA